MFFQKDKKRKTKNLLQISSYLIAFLFIFTSGVPLVDVASASGYAYVTKWGSVGTGDGQFASTGTMFVATDSSGNVYVSDTSNNRIQKFTSTGTFVTKWGSAGTGNSQFGSPYGIATDSSNNVYVADPGNNCIKVFDSSGNFVTRWGIAGSANGRFNFPSGVTVGASGNVYVYDSENYRVQKFDSTGVYITKWGSFGAGNSQFGSTYGNLATDSSENVYVADATRNRIQKFTSTGTYITQWGSSGTGNGQFNSPYSVFVDSSDNVYVTDSNNHRIQVFDVDGNYISQWGSSGTSNGQFSFPYGISVDSSGNIYVADAGNDRIQKFSYDGTASSVSYFNPADDATGVGKDATFEIAFDETIATSTGNIYLYKTSDDSLVETIDITGPKVTASSTNALIIDPSTSLDYSTGYYFKIDSTAIVDTVSNSYAGINTSTAWNFTTEADPTPPTTSAPAHSGGTTAQRQVLNLLDMGNRPLAEEVAKNYPDALVGVPLNSTSTATSIDSSEKVPKTNQTCNSYIFNKDLYFGLSDDEVLVLQQTLNCLGFTLASTGAGSQGFETSFFGSYTKGALIAFQKVHDIKPALGYFGPITRGRMNELLASKNN